MLSEFLISIWALIKILITGIFYNTSTVLSMFSCESTSDQIFFFRFYILYRQDCYRYVSTRYRKEQFVVDTKSEWKKWKLIPCLINENFVCTDSGFGMTGKQIQYNCIREIKMTENLILKRFKLWKKKSTGIKMTENFILKRFKLLEEKRDNIYY